VLVQELGALDTSHLRDIAVAYDMAALERAAGASAEELTRLIIDAVRLPRKSSTPVQRDAQARE